MRLALAQHFGGGPAYWLDPDLPEDVLSTAMDMVLEQDRNRRNARE